MSDGQVMFMGLWIVGISMVSFVLAANFSGMVGLWVLLSGIHVGYCAAIVFYLRRIALSCPEVNEFRDQPRGQ